MKVGCSPSRVKQPIEKLELALSSKFRIHSLFRDTVTVTSPRGSTDVIGHSPMSTRGNDNPDENSTDPTGLPDLLTDPVRRRSWLLAKALDTQPLDRALELARAAEAFITGAHANEIASTGSPLRSEEGAAPIPGANRTPLKHRTSLALVPETREQLLERLAQGARNAEVAREFGFSIRQVQGVRMGSKREIARRRDGR